MDTSQIQSYYNKCQKYYSLFWTDSKSLGVHHGLWYEQTRTKSQALMNHYIELADLFNLTKEKKILDAGCGIGGALFWLNNHVAAADYTGINISEKQIHMAQKKITRQDIPNIRILNTDFFRTDFPADYFDGVFGIESFCYAGPDTVKAFSEMNRILKMGGKFALFDLFLQGSETEAEKNPSLQAFLKGWKIAGIYSSNRLINLLETAGFRNIRFVDKTRYFIKNADLIHSRGRLSYPAMKLLRKLRIISQVEYEYAAGAVHYKQMVESGVLGYGLFYCEK